MSVIRYNGKNVKTPLGVVQSSERRRPRNRSSPQSRASIPAIPRTLAACELHKRDILRFLSVFLLSPELSLHQNAGEQEGQHLRPPWIESPQFLQ